MEYNRRDIKRECSKWLQIAGFRRIAYNHPATDQEGRTVIIPLALLDDQDKPSVAIRIRRPRKRETTRNKTTSNRSETIAKIAGCHVITIRSMAAAALLPGMIKKLFDL